jgi:hypothetical protein
MSSNVQLIALGSGRSWKSSTASLPSRSNDEVAFAAKIGLDREPHVDIAGNFSFSVDAEKGKLPQGVCKFVRHCRLNMNVRATNVCLSISMVVLFGQ